MKPYDKNLLMHIRKKINESLITIALVDNMNFEDVDEIEEKLKDVLTVIKKHVPDNG